MNEPLTIVVQTPERHSKSLPTSPTSSPEMHQKEFSGNMGRSIENLQVGGETDMLEPQEKNNFLRSSESLKRMQEERLLSSYESARTVVGSEELTSAEVFSISKEEMYKHVENYEANPEVKTAEGAATFETSLRRPNNLKGLLPFQKSHSHFPSLGLAFSVHGASTVASWPSLADKNAALPEDWANLAFSTSQQTSQSSESVDYRYAGGKWG